MSDRTKTIQYWTSAGGTSQPVTMFTGPERVGCVTMLGVVAVASVLAFGIVTALAWALE